MRLFVAVFLTAVCAVPPATAQDSPDPVFVLPESAPEKGAPLLVALHEYAATAAATAEEMRPLAEAGGFALLCPRAEGDGFTDEDLPRVLDAIEEASARIGAGKVHLVGRRDAGLAAIRFALTRPRAFRTVVAEGTDVPELRPASGSDRLRLLLLKGAEDRAEAGRESVERIRDDLEVAEFRLLGGAGKEIDPGSLSYVAYFISAVSGRIEAGRDLSLAWQVPARGLAIRKARKVHALVYLYDAGPAHRNRTELIQGEILFDADLREAMHGAIPILAPRSGAEEILPGTRLAPGPAIVVLDREGKPVGVLQKNLSARAIVLLLRR